MQASFWLVNIYDDLSLWCENFTIKQVLSCFKLINFCKGSAHL